MWPSSKCVTLKNRGRAAQFGTVSTTQAHSPGQGCEGQRLWWLQLDYLRLPSWAKLIPVHEARPWEPQSCVGRAKSKEAACKKPSCQECTSAQQLSCDAAHVDITGLSSAPPEPDACQLSSWRKGGSISPVPLWTDPGSFSLQTAVSVP